MPFQSQVQLALDYLHQSKFIKDNSFILQQLLPLAVVLLVPLFVLTARSKFSALVWTGNMLLENLGLSYAWNAVHDHFASSSSHTSSKKKSSARHKRTKSQSTRSGGSTAESSSSKNRDDDGYYPGLVNVSGTYCFLNSVIQAMASVSYLHPQIDAIHSKAEELDVPTPVIDALRDALQALNTPGPQPSALRPVPMINALSNPNPSSYLNGYQCKPNSTSSRLFSSREHQDAQELFQLLSECIKNEAQAVDAESLRDRGLGALAVLKSQDDIYVNTRSEKLKYKETGTLAQSVFDGLTANRRSCVECGYTEAVMHFQFDNWQLAVPHLTGVCTLQDCLTDYIRLELLTDCICRNCSMLATCHRLEEDIQHMTKSAGGSTSTELNGDAKTTMSQSKKKRLREAKRMLEKVKTALDEGRIEEEIKGLKMEKVFSRASTKQAMIARPPRVLALHLNRSMHFGNGYSSKNSCRVIFPEVLDLTPYTTSGQLSTIPSYPISSPQPQPSFSPAFPLSTSSSSSTTPGSTTPQIPRCTTPTQSTYGTPRVLYRLSAVVCHYGQHSFGHYVCFRRKPRLVSDASDDEDDEYLWRSGSGNSGSHLSPPRLACPVGCECAKCAMYGPVRDEGSDYEVDTAGSKKRQAKAAGKGWLRTSDDAVVECGIDRVLAEGAGAFMLFYERVLPPRTRPKMKSRRPSMSGVEMSTTASGSKTNGLNGSTSILPSTASAIAAASAMQMSMYALRSSPRSSEETVRPELIVNGSVSSFETTSSASSSSPSSYLNGHGQPLTQTYPYGYSSFGLYANSHASGSSLSVSSLKSVGGNNGDLILGASGVSPPRGALSPRVVRSAMVGRSRSASVVSDVEAEEKGSAGPSTSGLGEAKVTGGQSLPLHTPSVVNDKKGKGKAVTNGDTHGHTNGVAEAGSTTAETPKLKSKEKERKASPPRGLANGHATSPSIYESKSKSKSSSPPRGKTKGSSDHSSSSSDESSSGPSTPPTPKLSVSPIPQLSLDGDVEVDGMNVGTVRAKNPLHTNGHHNVLSENHDRKQGKQSNGGSKRRSPNRSNGKSTGLRSSPSHPEHHHNHNQDHDRPASPSPARGGKKRGPAGGPKSGSGGTKVHSPQPHRPHSSLGGSGTPPVLLGMSA